MRLKTKYILFASLALVAFSVLTALLYNYNKYIFLIGEVIVIISSVLFIVFYKSIIRPYRLLNSGIESIADKDFSIKFLPVGQAEPDRLIEVYNKMIDQLRLERIKATETHFFLKELIAASPAGIIILDTKNGIDTVNEAALRMINIDPKNTKISIGSLPPPWNRELEKLKESSANVVKVNGIDKFKCYRSVFLDRGVKRTFFLIEELSRELLQAEKQAFEKVIRMISHEVNNSLGSVSSIIDSTTQYLQSSELTDTNDFVNALEVAKERIENLNGFTKRFTEVVRIPPPDIQQCNLKEIVKRILIYFQTDMQNMNIRAKIIDNDNTNHIVSFDPQQLELVLINIIKNAMQAIDFDGNINVIINSEPSSLIIENNGKPIPPEVKEKLFTPFFTTKKNGQGIGLTLVREILVNNNCRFSLQTGKDGITEFKIVFCL